jgi:glucose-1-phosphate adenylyltransferase
MCRGDGLPDTKNPAWKSVDLGGRRIIKKAIIDKDVRIPKGMIIGFNLEEDKKKFFVSDSGIVVVAKGTEIK